MSYAQENGYTPVDFDTLMNQMRAGINDQFGTEYTEENFVGTGWYKYCYTIIQMIQLGEVKTSEIFLKLQEYINQTNLRIQRPSVSHPGIIDTFTAAGYVASVKANLEADAGTISICVDVDNTADDYATTRLAICNIIRTSVAAGLVSMGAEQEEITLSNGQAFLFKFSLPDPTPILLRLTILSSVNSLLVIPSDEQIRQGLFDNINERYRLGWNFEPERYYEVLADAPWAADILLEYSVDDGANWLSTVFDAAFDDLLTFDLEDITVIIDPE